MSTDPYGTPTPPSSSPYPELRYDRDGRPLGSGTTSGSGTGWPTPSASTVPGLGRYTPGQYSGTATAGTDPYAMPAGGPHGGSARAYGAGPAPSPTDSAWTTSSSSRVHQLGPDQTLLVVAWIVAVITSLYMLPWAIAVTRRRPDATAIALVTFFTGWTIVGWVVGLVWSLVGPSSVSTLPPPGWYPSPTGVGQQFWDGHAWTGHTQA